MVGGLTTAEWGDGLPPPTPAQGCLGEFPGREVGAGTLVLTLPENQHACYE